MHDDVHDAAPLSPIFCDTFSGLPRQNTVLHLSCCVVTVVVVVVVAVLPPSFYT